MFMNRFFSLVFALTVVGIMLSGCGTAEESDALSEAEPEKRALFIIVDGISADIIESVETPNLDRIIETGTYTRAWLGGEAGGYSESPTVSAVGYNHLITGVWSNKHNVYDNGIEDPNYNYWNLFRLFKENHPDKPVAIYSSWLDNRTRLDGVCLEEACRIDIDIAFEGIEIVSHAFRYVFGF